MNDRELRELILDWWRGHRPLNWSEAQHIADPMVNTINEREAALAGAAAAIAEKA